MAWLRKKLFENLSSTLYFEKTKKKLNPASKLSMNLSLQYDLRLKQKTTLSPDFDIYTRHYP